MGGALRRLMDRPPVVRAAATGLFTTLLPCGWLYAFVVTAAGTGSGTPLHGAALMAVFWLGTLPMMLTVGVDCHGSPGHGARGCRWPAPRRSCCSASSRSPRTSTSCRRPIGSTA